MRHWLTFIVSIIIATSFVAWSLHTADWNWFSRSGSVIIVVALLMEYWPILSTRSVSNMSFYADQETHTATRVAVPLACIGTLIWGFGDLVGTGSNF